MRLAMHRQKPGRSLWASHRESDRLGEGVCLLRWQGTAALRDFLSRREETALRVSGRTRGEKQAEHEMISCHPRG